jgi:hypothetical protein
VAFERLVSSFIVAAFCNLMISETMDKLILLSCRDQAFEIIPGAAIIPRTPSARHSALFVFPTRIEWRILLLWR